MSGGRTSGASGRVGRELAHHRVIADDAEAVWNWDGAAGQRRADRRADIFRELARLHPGRRALELGCGTGVFLGRVANSGADIVALDVSEDLLRRTRRALTGSPKVRLECGNAEQLCHRDGTFDAVYGSSVLHHLELEPALREVFRVLRPGGVMVFTEPNLLNPQIAWSFLVGPRRWFGLSPDEMAFTRARPARLLRGLGFRDVSVRPFDFLHPSMPARWTAPADRLGRALERVPLLKEIAGSLLIRAVRP